MVAYFVNVAALAVDPTAVPEEVKQALRKELLEQGNLGARYQLAIEGGAKASTRRAVTNSLMAAMTRYRQAVASGSTDLAREAGRLKEALRNYLRHAPSLLLHSERDGEDSFHLGEDGIAPYLFHPTVPYATAAFAWLKSVPGNSAEEMGELRDDLTRLVGSSPGDNGTIRGLGPNVHPTSPYWANAFTGLALIPLVQQCQGHPRPAGAGIVFLPSLGSARAPVSLVTTPPVPDTLAHAIFQ